MLQRLSRKRILGWFRKLVAQKFDGSKYRSYPGRPATSSEVVNLIVRLARDNSSWGYDRIAGALSNPGHKVSDQTVGNILRRHGIAPAPNRSRTTSWKEFIRTHMAVLSGMDFFTVEVLTWRGLVTYYVLFVIQLETRRVILAGMARHPTEEWMQQVARNRRIPNPARSLIRNTFCMTAMQSSVHCLPRPCRKAVATAQTSCPLAQSECLCGTMGPICKAGVSIQADPI